MYPTFFGKYSTVFQVAANQSTANDLEKNDLQVGMGTADNTGSNVTFNMSHNNGLAVILLGGTTVPTTTFVNTNQVSTETSINYATDEFETRIPYKTVTERQYIFVVKSNTATTFQSKSEVNNAWKSSLSVTASSNETKSVTAYSSRSYYNKGYSYSYTGASQTFTAPVKANYTIECWGAGAAEGTLGAYTKGVIQLDKDNKLYVYVGAASYSTASSTTFKQYVFNGGGGWEVGCGDHNNHSGGGATDIRLADGSWDEFNSLKSRIMVAGGGGGTVSAEPSKHSYGGGLTSPITIGAYGTPAEYTTANGAGQTYGYAFGKGEICTKKDGVGLSRAGGGGGYYGGYANGCAGAGGSSFISGYSGCDAISSSSTENNIIHTGQSVHYSNLKFTDCVMKAGSDTPIPSPLDGFVIGDGKAGHCTISWYPDK